MPFKRRLVQLHDARLVAIEKAKKRKVEQSLPTAQSCNKPLRTDTSDLDDSDDSEAATWFWNMSANESESEFESDEGGQSDEDEQDFESRTEVAVPLQPVAKEICWNKEGENKLRGIYGRGSVSSPCFG